jgi:hypothetical protein
MSQTGVKPVSGDERIRQFGGASLRADASALIRTASAGTCGSQPRPLLKAILPAVSACPGGSDAFQAMQHAISSRKYCGDRVAGPKIN